MRWLAAGLLCALAQAASPALSPYEIVRRSCEKDTRNLGVRQQYTHRETGSVRVLDKRGFVKRTELHVKEVLWIGGTRYSRAVEKNGKPLSPEEEKKEREKLEKEIARRKRESPEQRRKRIADEQKELQEERRLRMQIPEAFTFTLASEERVNGRDCYRITAIPKAGFKPDGRHSGLLPKLQGTLWIDKSDYEWTRVEADTLDTISAGLGLLRVGKGARLEVEQAVINDELWAPTMFRIAASARALLLMNARFDAELRFHDYKKYSVDSVVTLADNP